MKAAGVTVEPYYPGLFAKLLEKTNMDELISAIGSAPAAGGGGGGGDGGGGGGEAAAEEKKEESEEEEEEEMGAFCCSMFAFGVKPFCLEHVLTSFLFTPPLLF